MPGSLPKKSEERSPNQVEVGDQPRDKILIILKSGELFRMRYPFRTGWALLLLGVNLLVAAYYFHIIE